jgi:hypothetical protein
MLISLIAKNLCVVGAISTRRIRIEYPFLRNKILDNAAIEIYAAKQHFLGIGAAY